MRIRFLEKDGISKLQAFENLPRLKITITVVVKADVELSITLACVVLNHEGAHRWLRERFSKSVLITLIHGNISIENNQI